MLPEFGGDTYAGADNFMNGRANGVATYRNNVNRPGNPGD